MIQIDDIIVLIVVFFQRGGFKKPPRFCFCLVFVHHGDLLFRGTQEAWRWTLPFALWIARLWKSPALEVTESSWTGQKICWENFGFRILLIWFSLVVEMLRAYLVGDVGTFSSHVVSSYTVIYYIYTYTDLVGILCHASWTCDLVTCVLVGRLFGHVQQSLCTFFSWSPRVEVASCKGTTLAIKKRAQTVVLLGFLLGMKFYPIIWGL